MYHYEGPPERPGLLARIKGWVSGLRQRRSSAIPAAPRSLPQTRAGRFRRLALKIFSRGILIMVVGLPLFFVIGMIYLYRIGNDTTIQPERVTERGSYTVDLLSEMIRRETIENEWVANDLIISPGYFLDNSREFQIGLYSALSQIVQALEQDLFRVSGAAGGNPNLARARQLLSLGAELNVVNFSGTIVTDSAEHSMNQARLALNNFNAQFAAQPIPCRGDALGSTLNVMIGRLGNLTAGVGQVVIQPRFWLFDRTSDNMYYKVKGDSYALLVALKGLRRDCEPILVQTNADQPFDEMLAELERANSFTPLVVMNSSNHFLWANHLYTQGFHLSRAMALLQNVILAVRQ